MREFITVDREVNQIRLRRSTFKGTFLLVEGDTDKKFYSRFIDRAACQIVILSGKPSSKQRVIAVLEKLENSEFQGILAIVDADCDRLLETLPYNSPNLLRTDTHDLETMLLKSPALEKVLAEFGSEEKISKFQREIRDVLLVAGLSVGYLRWISQVERLELTFNGIDFGKFIDKNTIEIQETQLIEVVKKKSQRLDINNQDISDRIVSIKNPSHDPWQVCCGHDLVEIFSWALRKAIGSHNPNDVKPESLERNLRLAYETADFYQTHLYCEIRTWESNNQPFKVLASASDR